SWFTHIVVRHGYPALGTCLRGRDVAEHLRVTMSVSHTPAAAPGAAGAAAPARRAAVGRTDSGGLRPPPQPHRHRPITTRAPPASYGRVAAPVALAPGGGGALWRPSPRRGRRRPMLGLGGPERVEAVQRGREPGV